MSTTTWFDRTHTKVSEHQGPAYHPTRSFTRRQYIVCKIKQLKHMYSIVKCHDLALFFYWFASETNAAPPHLSCLHFNPPLTRLVIFVMSSLRCYDSSWSMQHVQSAGTCSCIGNIDISLSLLRYMRMIFEIAEQQFYIHSRIQQQQNNFTTLRVAVIEEAVLV